ncbi:hypothetical protein [Lactiplantibacillus plantarum]|uniref:Uncharacterized protein n=2 Tax=Lactiplantibacillus plantarum TaxID=1590 RepID=A0A076G3R6_LACPN|nr:hypothetical protein [Lactiplantibacillus plantarum]EYR70530.1 hypothetical protein O209_14205 [Lactiplantibacillus plantarum WHE 92]AII26517.1 hypothetical protein [Lactiplantibacillus plantarum subsp. plantarum]AZU40745.1 hypothetical protein B1H25_14505 [Lactiplantibacillus plantarum]MCI3956667.1 hypothetical protein [Lactiplantibacillus plantarum]MCW6140285.1 hypothetical protein [Lactiplantibacillus plantarum]
MSWSYDKSQQTPILATLENTVEKQKQAILTLDKEVNDMDATIKLQQAQIQRLNSENETLSTAKSSQSIDRLTIAIEPIADDLQRLTRQANAFLKRLREQRLFKQLQAKLNKSHRRYPSRRRRGRER